MGWIGPTKRVEEWLIAHGAERAPTGEYLIQGSRPTFGLGGDEVVIPDDTYVVVDGAKVNLADALTASGGGVGVRVISEYQENPLAINHDYPRAHALQSDLTRYYEECKRSKSARGRFIGGRLKQYCSGVAWKRVHLAGRYKDYARYKGKKSMRRAMPVRRAAEMLQNPLENQLSPSGMWALGIAGVAALGIGAYLLFRAKPAQTTTASYTYPTSQNINFSNGGHVFTTHGR